jgi:hypothetical protein
MLALIALVFSVPAGAEVMCHGSFSRPGTYLNGSCRSGSCSAYVPAGSVSENIYCGNASARIQGSTPGGFVDGRCNGRTVSLYLQGTSFQLNGSCYGGGTFSGYATTTPGFVSGSCTEDGGFSVFLPSVQVTFSGACR